MPEFRIEPQIFGTAPDLLVGVLTAKNIKNLPSSPDVVEALRTAERDTRSAYASVDAVAADPRMTAWENLHKAFGNKPNKNRPSIIALLRRIAQGKDLSSIGTLVDIYNAVSLRHGLPAGAEDLDRCEGDIRLCVAKGGEPFRAFHQEKDDPPRPGEFIYADNAGALCRNLNWQEAERTCLTDRTRNAVFVLEAIPPTTREQLMAALTDLRRSVHAHCGGESTMDILDHAKPSMPL